MKEPHTIQRAITQRNQDEFTFFQPDGERPWNPQNLFASTSLSS